MNWDNTSGRYFTPSLSMSESYITMVSDAFAENIQNQVMGCDFYNNQYMISACDLTGFNIPNPEYFCTMALGMA